MTLKQRLGTWLIPRLPVNPWVFRIFRVELNAMMVRSIQLPTFQAASTPNVTARVTATVSVVSASETVGSMRWPISLATG